jgi:uncharacterized membrane protein YiaA
MRTTVLAYLILFMGFITFLAGAWGSYGRILVTEGFRRQRLELSI